MKPTKWPVGDELRSRLDPHVGAAYVGPAVVGVLRIEVHIGSARSLKEKRAVLRPVLDAARSRYRVGIAEVAYQDLHQRAAIEVAAVASAAHVVTGVLDAVERLVWSAPDLEVISCDRHWAEQD